MLNKNDNQSSKAIFTKEMKEDYTILIPDMIPTHFSLYKNILEEYGYKVELLENEGPSLVHEGLKYVHNDTCYPALLVIGQMIDALKSGKYDLNKIALLISQTGGGCRASNYIHLLRKALKKAGFEHIPVISFNVSGLEKGSGFRLTLPMIKKLLIATTYGDMLMLLHNQVKPYEVSKGESDKLLHYWVDLLGRQFKNNQGYKIREVKENLDTIVNLFSQIPIYHEDKTKVGIVGEIYVKYSKLANNHLVDFLIDQDCEVMVPGLMGFVIFTIDNRLEDINIYGGSSIKTEISSKIKNFLVKYEKMIIDAVKTNGKFTAPSTFEHLKSLGKDIIGHGCKMGEGWVLTAEMVDLVKTGYENIVCAQPFGCLPNHIIGKGMIRKIKDLYPAANIVPIDYDPSATKVNQENRIKLMLSVAKENLELIHPRKVKEELTVSETKAYKFGKKLELEAYK